MSGTNARIAATNMCRKQITKPNARIIGAPTAVKPQKTAETKTAGTDTAVRGSDNESRNITTYLLLLRQTDPQVATR
jgi:hypothetical protein